jgi:4-amino-4-deoxy-L-arabinose transferase-like glycosyltransferase
VTGHAPVGVTGRPGTPTAKLPSAVRVPVLALSTVRGRRTWLGVLLATAGLLYSLGLSGSGWANAYYSAAAQAGAHSWQAFLFGGLDPAGGISVDKPPAALWLTGLSVRLFGLSTPALLLPQALCAVAAVGLLYATVRRQALALTGPSPAGAEPAGTREARAVAAGLLAGTVLALTPVVTLLARYDNPDALMVLLSVAAGYALTRSVERHRNGGGWLAAAGLLLGLAFLTKLMQAWLVMPAFVAVAVVAGAGSVGRRLARTAAAGAAMVAAAGWWVLVVQLTPADRRPWIGGSRGNSVIELALGYNGFGRITGQEGGGGAADGARPGSWLRLFGSWAPEGGWLLPAAIVGLSAGWWLTRGRDRRDPLRAGLLLWGGWLLVAGAVLSSLRGISHSYYAIQLAPAIAGATALGGALLWDRTRRPGARRSRWLLATTVAVTAVWSAGLLLTRPSWPLVVAPLVLGAAIVAVAGLRVRRAGAIGQRLVGAAVLVAVLAGPAAWSAATAQAVHRGSNVYAGPGVTAVQPAAGYAPGLTVRLPTAVVDQVRAGAAGHDWAAAVVGRRAADLQLASGVPVWSLGGFSGNDPHPTLSGFRSAVAAGRVHYLVIGSERAAPRSDADRIVQWATSKFTSTWVGRWQVVDLTTATGVR